MNQSPITTEILYEFMKQFKEDFVEFKKETRDRFEQVNQDSLEFKKEVRDRFDQVNRDSHDLRDLIKQDKEKLEKVYESRDKVTVSFTRSWMTASFFIAILSVLIVLAVEKGLT